MLCENKEKPEKQGCNGKCHLKKQLDQQKPVEEKHPFSKSASLSFYPDLLAVFTILDKEKDCFASTDSFEIPYKHIATNKYIKDIFHPPEV